MTKKVVFPLKLKIITLFSVLITVAMLLYSYSAIELFKKDKTAYVYEASLNGLDFLHSRLKQKNDDIKNRLSILKATYKSLDNQKSQQLKTSLQDFLSKDREALSYYHYELSPPVKDSQYGAQRISQWENPQKLSQYGVGEEDFFESLKSKLSSFLNSPPLSTKFLVNPLHELDLKLPPHMLVISPQKAQEKTSLHFLLIDLSPFLDSMENQKVFQFFIRDENKNVLRLGTGEVKKEFSSSTFQQIHDSTQDLNRGVKQLTLGEEKKYLVGFKNIEDFNFQLYSLIPHTQAFAAANFLTRQSLYFGAFVLALIVIIGIFFSRNLTKQLERLHLGTQKIAEGDFQSQVEVKSRDEIGALGQSFNFMSAEIRRYMEEMKEKQRLENELKVAQLVQETFIPPQDIETQNLHVSSFYVPATECGGDWWGHIQKDERTLFFIADATGHGVPAAFLTATVHSCVKTLDILTTSHPHLLNTPTEIMQLLNQTVLNIGKGIYLTSFIGIFHHKDMSFTYANASHLEPLVLRPKGKEELTKSDFIPLLEGKGPRLGHKQNAEFEQGFCQLEDEDTLIMWTDGITECTSPEGKQWGQRKFLKTLLAHGKESSQTIRNAVIEELDDHRQDHEYEDDLTLVIAKFRSS